MPGIGAATRGGRRQHRSRAHLKYMETLSLSLMPNALKERLQF